MYTDWFKLKKLPFRLRPDPEFLYLADETEVVYAALRAAMVAEQRLVCLLGESGVGKTTLLHALARDCQGTMSVVRVQQPNLTSLELAATLSEQLGLPPQIDTNHKAWAHLHRHVASEAAHGHPVIILVDEAHRCTDPMMRELLMRWRKCSPAPGPRAPSRLPSGRCGCRASPRRRLPATSTTASESQAATAASCLSRTRLATFSAIPAARSG